MTDQPQRNSRWYHRYLRFSIRGLILMVLLIGGGMGWIIRGARDQFAAVKAIEAAGGNVSYGWEWTDGRSVPDGAPWWPKWLSDRIGVDYLGSVTRVELFFGCTDKERFMSAVSARWIPFRFPASGFATPTWRIWKGSGDCTR